LQQIGFIVHTTLQIRMTLEKTIGGVDVKEPTSIIGISTFCSSSLIKSIYKSTEVKTTVTDQYNIKVHLSESRMEKNGKHKSIPVKPENKYRNVILHCNYKKQLQNDNSYHPSIHQVKLNSATVSIPSTQKSINLHRRTKNG
jgi:hypothetical protein